MKSRKGFTLIELIAVIVILGLVILIAVPFFQGSLKTFRDDYYSALKTNVVNSAKDFFGDNRLYLPNRYLESAKVDLNTLEAKSYLKNVKDYNGDSCDLNDSYVIAVKTSREKYEYAVCMRCSGDDFEDVESVYCNKAWDNKYGHTEVVFDNPSKVMVYKGTSRDRLKEQVKVYPDIRRCLGIGNECEEEIKRVSAEGEEGVQAIYPINLDSVDTSKVGTYTVQYKYDEISPVRDGEVEVYEHAPATISAKKLNTIYDTTDSDNTVKKGKKKVDVTTDYDQNNDNDWAQKLNIKLNYTGSVGSETIKVARYQWYRNGRWEDYCVPARANASDTNNSCNKTIGNVSGSNEQFNDNIKFRFIDVNGNVSKENTFKVRIDFTPPEACELKLTGTIRNGWYYSDTVKVEFSYKDDATRTSPNGTAVKSGIALYGITKKAKPTSNTPDGTQSTDTTGVTWYGYTEDKAENFTVCSITFKKDSTAPTCTKDGDNTTWKNTEVTIKWGCTDETSECATADGSKTFNENATFTKTWTKAAYDIYDKAGNKTTCPELVRDVYYDKQEPTCTDSGDNTTWKNTEVEIKWGCKDQDGASGCKTSDGSKKFNANKSYTKTWEKAAYDIEDNAGNKKTCPKKTRNVYYDKKVPTCVSSDGDPNWRNTNLTIKGTCSEAEDESGCVSNITYEFKTNTDTKTASPGKVKDTAGNETTCPGDQEVHIDKTAPTCVSSDGDPNWRNTDLTIKGTCTDTGGSGCSNITKKYDKNTNSKTESPGTVKDGAGNTANCPADQEVHIDKTAPTCVSSDGDPNWRNTDLTIKGTCTDTGGSGCSNITKKYDKNTNSKTESPGTVKDGAGNTKACPADQEVHIDKTAPTCTSSGGSTSWTNGTVTLTGTCTDTGGSGCNNITKDFSEEINTTTASAGTVTDGAGNTGDCSADQTVKIDKTGPSCSMGSGSTVDIGSTGDLVLTCTDTGSGVATASLAKTDFTLENNKFSIESVTTGTATNGKKYTLSMKAANNGTTKVTLKGSTVKDAVGNYSSDTPDATMTGRRTYTLSYDCNGGTGSTSASTCTITTGTSCDVTLRASGCSKTNNDFNGWADSNTATSGSAASSSKSISANSTVYATWKASAVPKTKTETVYSTSKNKTFSVTITKGYTSGTVTATATNGTPTCSYKSATKIECTVKNMSATTPNNTSGCQTMATGLGYSASRVANVEYLVQHKVTETGVKGDTGCYEYVGYGSSYGFNSSQNWSCKRYSTTIFNGQTDHCPGIGDYTYGYTQSGYYYCKCWDLVGSSYYTSTVTINYHQTA